MTALRKMASTRDDARRIVERINVLTHEDLDGFGAWQDLADLSSNTLFTEIDGDPDSVVIDSAGHFEAIAAVYVTLVYGSARDQETMSDEYLATVTGHLAIDGVAIEQITVDTMPFYE